MAFPLFGNSDHVVVSVSIDFPKNSKKDTLFHHIVYDYSHADWGSLHDHLSEFCEWVQVGINIHILHPKYMVKSHSSPWFSAAFAAAIVHKNHFFRLCQQTKSSESKAKFRQASNYCLRFLEAPKLTYATETKVSITSLGTFVEFLIVFSTKVNLLYLL